MRLDCETMMGGPVENFDLAAFWNWGSGPVLLWETKSTAVYVHMVGCKIVIFWRILFL